MCRTKTKSKSGSDGHGHGRRQTSSGSVLYQPPTYSHGHGCSPVLAQMPMGGLGLLAARMIAGPARAPARGEAAANHVFEKRDVDPGTNTAKTLTAREEKEKEREEEQERERERLHEEYGHGYNDNNNNNASQGFRVFGTRGREHTGPPIPSTRKRHGLAWFRGAEERGRERRGDRDSYSSLPPPDYNTATQDRPGRV